MGMATTVSDDERSCVEKDLRVSRDSGVQFISNLLDTRETRAPEDDDLRSMGYSVSYSRVK